jgi:hypothetical protein
MKNDVRVGDYFYFSGNNFSVIGVDYFFNELDEITTRNCLGRKNHFDYDSIYGKKCIKVYHGSSSIKVEYDNGIPMVWGDNI